MYKNFYIKVMWCMFNMMCFYFLVYVWMEFKIGEDVVKLMDELKIRIRGGERFGVLSNYIRVSMLESDDIFNFFFDRFLIF